MWAVEDVERKESENEAKTTQGRAGDDETRQTHTHTKKTAQNKYKLVALTLAVLVASNMSDAKSSWAHGKTGRDQVALWINMYICLNM